MTARRVAACIVTGFLGSGKTTLLRGLLARDPGRERIAVIVNEIGEIGIDGRVLSGFEFAENVVELASGCVCCSIDEYRFDLAVDELVRRLDPTLLVLETTGVADPAPLVERLRRCGVGVDSIVTVVDATAWGIAARASGTARRQVAAADFLVLSKCELAGARAVGRLRERLARRNPRALLLERAGHDEFPGADLLLATTAAARARRASSPDSGDAREPHSHLQQDQVESFSWQSDRGVDLAAFEGVLRSLPAGVLRAKGLVRNTGESRATLFQVVCGRVELSVLEGRGAPAEGVQAVFIGRGILDSRGQVLAALEACSIPPAAPRAEAGAKPG